MCTTAASAIPLWTRAGVAQCGVEWHLSFHYPRAHPPESCIALVVPKRSAPACAARANRVCNVGDFETHNLTCTTRIVHTFMPRRTTRVLINQKQLHSTSPAVVVESGRYLNTPPFNAEANKKYTTKDPIDFSIEERRCLQNPVQKNTHPCLVNLVPS